MAVLAYGSRGNHWYGVSRVSRCIHFLGTKTETGSQKRPLLFRLLKCLLLFFLRLTALEFAF